MRDAKSKSLEIAKNFLEKEVEVLFDRPLGSRHPKHGFVYEVNYGYIPGVKAPDGEDLDAYYLGTDQPLETATGIAKAIIHRLDNDDDKLVVMPKDLNLNDDEIEKAVRFQEQWFKHVIIRE
jgi:inorganic pyrophosphatase